MQVNINSNLTRVNPYHTILHNKTQNKNMSSPIAMPQNNTTFLASPVITKTVSSKITSEKSKLLRHFKEILATNIPDRTQEDIAIGLLVKAHNLIDKIQKRQIEISAEMDIIASSKTMNPKQKYDAGKKLLNEFNRISKINPFEIPKVVTKPSNENYDYVLINKFKNAVLSDNFDLGQVFKEHYSELENIQSINELKEKYPSIKIPQNPKKVITQKIIDIIPRDFYEQLDEIFQKGDKDYTANCLLNFFVGFFNELAPIFEIDDVETLHNLIGQEVIEKCIDTYYQLVDKGSMSSIPESRKSYVPAITKLEKQLLHIDFDKFALSVIRQQYLEGKKLSDITYQENGRVINLSETKSSEYKFEKVSEKIKKFITDSEKIRLAQRDYQKFTPSELKARLNHYLNTELGNNEKFLEIFIDFDSCKFTEEDKQYLIKFLQKLDEINDGKTSLKEALDYTEKNNIKPHGTAKLNEAERKIIEERIKNEQQKTLQLNKLRQDFNEVINKLYEYNMNSVAEEFIEYYPEDFEENSISNAKQIINLIENSMKLKDPHKIKTSILRLKIYNEYSKKDGQEDSFTQAKKYGSTFEQNEEKQRCGQYLLNRELLKNYPASKDLFFDKEMAERIINRFGDDIDTATLCLCKYENYKMLNPNENQYLAKILEIFDYKNSDDKVLLKNIIEKDYVNLETRIHNEHLNKEIVITPSAKQGILDKYKFPSCMEFFLAFEEAMSLLASKLGSSGVKRIESGGRAGSYQIELKIMGHPDRLFSSKNDFIFDIYSEKGLH